MVLLKAEVAATVFAINIRNTGNN